jgi:aldehyde:ferredoxin oxidoreductase
MMRGYANRIAVVNLSEWRLDVIEPEASVLENFIGGRGLGVATLLGRGPQVAALSEQGLLCILTGPLTGTKFPLSNRLCLVFRSPATGTIAWANTGGYLAVALKNAGFDGLMVVGQSQRPCYLLVGGGRVEIRDASTLWGKGAIDATGLLQKAHGKVRVLAIGPAGEALSPIATVINDKGRASGVRHGVGAVFGGKGLKGIVLEDVQRASAEPDKDAWSALRARVGAKLRASAVLNPKDGTMSVHGTGIAVEALGKTESLPVRNYSRTVLPGYREIGGMAMSRTVLTDRLTCSFCPVRCRRETGSTGRFRFQVEGPDYAQLVSLGTNCGLTDLEAVSYMNFLCYELGIDPIEMGNALAMLAEATEIGQIRDGLRWGDVDGMIQRIEQTGAGVGVGEVLRLGASRAAALLGVPELAMSVKGISLQNCDPRPEPAWGLLNATETYGGAAHIWCYGDLVWGMREVGVEALVEPSSSARHIAEMVRYKQDLVALLDSVTVCTFSSYAYSLEDYAEALRLVTGIDLDEAELLARGGRIVDAERAFNVTHGFGPEDDTLPLRFTREPVPSGLHEGKVCDLGPLLDEYYRVRDWPNPAHEAAPAGWAA